jgi:hypothetical protein
MAEETFTQYDFKDDETGKNFVVFSKGAKPQPIGNFESAIDKYYSNNKKVPQGFVILPRDSYAAMGRQLFENVNAPVQAAATRIDAGLPLLQRPLPQQPQSDDMSRVPFFQQPAPPPGGVAQLLARRTMGNPEGAVEGNVDNAGLTHGLTSQFDTPGKAGLQAGLMLATPWLKPVTSSINTGVNAGKVAANRLGILSNIGKSTLAGGTGSVLMDAVFGEPAPFDTPKLIADFGSAFAAGGLQAGVGVLINKFVSPRLHEQVATDILKPIADRYPNYKTDPTLFDAATSSPQKLKDMTVAMAKGMRGTLDDVATAYKDEIVNAIPQTSTYRASMSVADQATLRAHLRRAVRAGNEILDNMGDPKAQDIARQALQDAVKETGKFVTSVMKKEGVQDLSKADAQVAAVTGKLKSDLANFAEGARVLDAMRQSGQQNGFDPMAFRDILVGKVTSGQQDLMGEVARKLGMGQPLQAAPAVAPPEPPNVVLDVLQRYVPGLKQIGNMIGMATKGEPTVGKLPWQLQQGALPRATAIGVASQGKEAIDSFMNRKSDITINIEKRSK